MNKFGFGGNISTGENTFNLQSIATARGAGLTEGLINNNPRLGSAVVQNGTFVPAVLTPPVGPMLQANATSLLWGTQTPSTVNTTPAEEIPKEQEGAKLPQIESNNARPLMGLFRHMIPGFNNAYKLKLYLAAYLLKLRQKFLSNLHKLPFMEPAVKANINTYNGGQLPGITVEAIDLSKPQRFPYGGINVESKSVRGGLDRKQRTYVNPFEGHDLVAKNQEGNKLPIALDAKEIYVGEEIKPNNTRVRKPIPGIVSKDSEVRTYDGVPVRVNKNYPQQDKYLLEAPTRELNLPWKKQKINAKYPHVYGVELTTLLPQYMLVIDNNDTTYYVQGKDDEYYPVAGQSSRPVFRLMFNKQGSPSQYKVRRVPYEFVRNLK